MRGNMSIANAVITATLLWLLTALLFLLTLLLGLLTSLLVAAAPLGVRGKRQHQRHCEESDECFHANSISSFEIKVFPYPHVMGGQFRHFLDSGFSQHS